MSPFVWFLILTGAAALFGFGHEWAKASAFVALVVGIIGFALLTTAPIIGWIVMIINPIGSLLTMGGGDSRIITIILPD